MGYDVRILAEVREIDMPALLAIDPALGRSVAQIVAELRHDPRIGVEMRERMRLQVLASCRKVPFDVAGWKGKPRFRLVYRNDPDDGSIAVVTVVAAGHRSALAAYREAAARVGARERARRAGR